VVTYTTIINAPNDDMKLKPGMTANIVIYTKEVNNAMLIPAKALAFTPDSTLMKDYQIVGKVAHARKNKAAGTAGGSPTANQVSHSAKSRSDSSGITKQRATVWVLEGKKLVQKRIEIGLNDNTHVEVLKGLAATDLVATGITGGPNGSAAAAPGASPFLPQRRGGGGGGRGR
jgi:HlyD family secretion protein